MKWSRERKERHSRIMKEKCDLKRLGEKSPGVVEAEERAKEIQDQIGKDVQNVSVAIMGATAME